jgi:hypothetical protein
MYERVQGRSRAVSEDQWQEYRKGCLETWALETTRPTIGANNWQSRAPRRLQAAGSRRHRRKNSVGWSVSERCHTRLAID